MHGDRFGLRRLNQVLIPNHRRELTAHNRVSTRRDETRSGEVDNDEFLPPHRHERTLGDLEEQDDRHPFRRTAHALTGDETEKNRARHHHDADEQHRRYGVPREPVDKRLVDIGQCRQRFRLLRLRLFLGVLRSRFCAFTGH